MWDVCLWPLVGGRSNNHVTKPVNLFSLCANFRNAWWLKRGGAGDGGDCSVVLWTKYRKLIICLTQQPCLQDSCKKKRKRERKREREDWLPYRVDKLFKWQIYVLKFLAVLNLFPASDNTNNRGTRLLIQRFCGGTSLWAVRVNLSN